MTHQMSSKDLQQIQFPYAIFIVKILELTTQGHKLLRNSSYCNKFFSQAQEKGRRKTQEVELMICQRKFKLSSTNYLMSYRSYSHLKDYRTQHCNILHQKAESPFLREKNKKDLSELRRYIPVGKKPAMHNSVVISKDRNFRKSHRWHANFNE